MALNYFNAKNFKLSVILLLLCFSFMNNEVNALSNPLINLENFAPQDTTPEKYPVLAIEPTRMNILYLGVDNPLTIAVSGIRSDELLVSTNNGTIKKHRNGEYLIRPSRKQVTTISVSSKKRSLGSRQYRVLQMPDPEVFIQTLPRKSESVSMAQLLAAKGLVAKLDDFIFDVLFRVTSFSVHAIISGEEKTADQNEGPNFTVEQRSLIRNVKRGDAVHFKDIKVMGPDSLERDIAPITIKIR